MKIADQAGKCLNHDYVGFIMNMFIRVKLMNNLKMVKHKGLRGIGNRQT